MAMPELYYPHCLPWAKQPIGDYRPTSSSGSSAAGRRLRPIVTPDDPREARADAVDAQSRLARGFHVEDRQVTLSSMRTVRLYARGGAIGLGELTDKGELEFAELRRIRTSRKADGNGLFRWYNEYALPEPFGGKHVMVRLHGNDEDAARRFNRTENVRPIASSDPDFKQLYARRSDSESINRGLEDTLYLNRAHSVGHARQHVNLLGYALMVNSMALHEHRRRRKLAAAA